MRVSHKYNLNIFNSKLWKFAFKVVKNSFSSSVQQEAPEHHPPFSLLCLFSRPPPLHPPPPPRLFVSFSLLNHVTDSVRQRGHSGSSVSPNRAAPRRNEGNFNIPPDAKRRRKKKKKFSGEFFFSPLLSSETTWAACFYLRSQKNIKPLIWSPLWVILLF